MRHLLENSSTFQDAMRVAFLETLFLEMPVGIGLVDVEGRIIDCNPQMAALAAAIPDQLAGRDFREVIPPELAPFVNLVFERGLAGESTHGVEFTGNVPGDSDGPHVFLGNFHPVIEASGAVAAFGVTMVDITDRRRSERSIDEILHAAIAAVAAAAEMRDPYTAGHQQRVAELSVLLASKVGVGVGDTEGIRLAATIHDIGKIGVPSEILVKPVALIEPEFQLVKAHAQMGHDIVAGIPFPWPVADMILQHHERFDGRGYPIGLRGDEILLGARIIHVADALEVMLTHRPYRAALGVDEALKELTAERGGDFDPLVVDAYLAMVDEGLIDPSAVAASI